MLVTKKKLNVLLMFLKMLGLRMRLRFLLKVKRNNSNLKVLHIRLIATKEIMVGVLTKGLKEMEDKIMEMQLKVMDSIVV